VEANTKKPVAGASVLFGHLGDARYFEWGDRDNYIDGHHSLTWIQRGTTDRDGHFWFCEDVAEAGALIIAAAGYARDIIRPEDRPPTGPDGLVQIALHPEAVIRGTLLADGRARNNASMRLWREEPRGQLDETFEAAKTGADGRFEFSRLAPGTYHLSVERWLTRYSTTTEPIESITLGAGETKTLGQVTVSMAWVREATIDGAAHDGRQGDGGSSTVPAGAARIEAVFAELHANWDARCEFARKKWNGMSAVEQAKFVNRYMAQQPPRGMDWEPTEEEAKKFLTDMGLTGKDDGKERDFLRWVVGDVRARLSEDEAAPFDARETSLIESLASMGTAIADGLLAKVKGVPRDSPAWREARWAARAVGAMGEKAIPHLARAIEKAFEPDQRGYNELYTRMPIVRALDATRSPKAIPALRRALEFPDRSVRVEAIQALERLPEGLTQKMLIDLWEDGNAYVRRQAARLLGQRGDGEALRILERDIPTAYADARYRAEYAVWGIKRRIDLTVGRVLTGGDPPEAIR
jgi:hypothetical protein